MSLRRHRSRIGRAGLWAYAALIYTFLYAPVFTVIVLSFNNSLIVGLPFRGFTLKWFWVVFTRQEVVTPLANSLLLGILTATVGTTLAMLLAMAFRRPFPGNGILFYFIIAPIVVPGVVSGVLLLIFFGLLGIRLSLWTTVFVAHVTWVLPFAFLSLYSRLHQFDQSLEEAAADLGAPKWMIFRRIVFPLISPGVIAASLFAFSLSFDEFVRTLFLTAFDRTLPVQFWYMVIESLSPEAPAMAVIIIIISVTASLAGTIIANRSTTTTSGTRPS